MKKIWKRRHFDYCRKHGLLTKLNLSLSNPWKWRTPPPVADGGPRAAPSQFSARFSSKSPQPTSEKATRWDFWSFDTRSERLIMWLNLVGFCDQIWNGIESLVLVICGISSLWFCVTTDQIWNGVESLILVTLIPGPRWGREGARIFGRRRWRADLDDLRRGPREAQSCGCRSVYCKDQDLLLFRKFDYLYIQTHFRMRSKSWRLRI